MKQLFRRPAAIALAMAAGVGVACVVGLSQQTGSADAGEFHSESPAPVVADDRRATPRAPQPEAALPPRRLEVPRLDLAARVLPTGVEPSGQAEIPPDGDNVGWYEFGAAPGDPKGAAVLIGHRDTAEEGPGALFEIDQLRAGDRILVSSRTTTLVYRATDLDSFDKQALPASLFRRTGGPELHLITCGGSFDPRAGGYQENLVVSAVLVRAVER